MKKKYTFLSIVFFLSLYGCSDFSGSKADSAGSVFHGSYSTMLSLGNKLYTVSKEELSTIDISTPDKPKLLDKQNVGFRIENLFHTSGILFIGSQTAMHIYSLNAEGIPIKKSTTNYAALGDEFFEPCDPVVSDGKYAYATLSSVFEGACSRTFLVNELRIYDITNLNEPKLVSTFQMSNPKGLALKENNLYICEKEHGLTILDITNKLVPVVTNNIKDCNCYDVIIRDQLLLAVGQKEIFQYLIGPDHAITQLQTIQF